MFLLAIFMVASLLWGYITDSTVHSDKVMIFGPASGIVSMLHIGLSIFQTKKHALFLA